VTLHLRNSRVNNARLLSNETGTTAVCIHYIYTACNWNSSGIFLQLLQPTLPLILPLEWTSDIKELTPWSTVLLEKLLFLQLLKKLPTFYGSQRTLPCSLLIPVLSQTNPVHDLTSNVFGIYFNFILLPMPRSSKWPLSFRFIATKSL
jgi:hypothetical protein